MTSRSGLPHCTSDGEVVQVLYARIGGAEFASLQTKNKLKQTLNALYRSYKRELSKIISGSEPPEEPIEIPFEYKVIMPLSFSDWEEHKAEYLAMVVSDVEFLERNPL